MRASRFELVAVLLVGVLFATACSDDAEPGPGGGGLPAAGGSGAPSGLLPTELYPLANGNSWTYHVTFEVVQPACIEGVRTAAMSGPATFEGYQAFSVTNICDDWETQLAEDNGEIMEWMRSFWAVALPAPVEEGYTWTMLGVTQYSWRDLGSVTVTAGTFADCWERTSSWELEATNTYCPGIGIVRVEESGYVAELISYTVQ